MAKKATLEIPEKPEDEIDDEIEDEIDEENAEKEKTKKVKKETESETEEIKIEDILANHEERLRIIESWIFRLKSL